MNRRNLGYLIAISALFISIPRYIATFAEIDPLAVTAYGMGILLAGGAAYMVDAWADARKRQIKRANHLLIALAINLIYEPVLLTPFILSRLWSLSLAEVMSNGYALFWSVMVTLAPVLLVFGVVYAVWFHQQPKQETTESKQTTNRKKHRCPVPGCNTEWDTAKQLAGHMNAHRSNNGKEPQHEHHPESR